MKVILRAGSGLLLGFFFTSVPVLAQNPVVSQTNATVRIMAANLNGNTQSYQPFAIRIFQGLQPDIVAIQEFNYGNNTPADFRAMLDTAFGTNFVYFRESGYNIPNGIISRFPILASGSWDDPLVNDRGFAWAQLDLPGSNDLYVVSVHLYSGGTTTDRNTEASTIKNRILTDFPPNAWIIVAGDFNTDSRSEAAVTTFKTFLSDSSIPSDAESGGDSDTNEPRSKPFDYVLPSFSLAIALTNAVFPSHVFPNGLVFDSRVYTPLSDVAPVLSADSGNAQHMAVLKDFKITWWVTTSSPDVPLITAQPQNQTASVGSNVTFAVTASGAAPLNYQWQFNGNSVSGATTNSYTRLNVQLSEAGSYSVVVTNSAGSVTSSAAVLTVGIPPMITAQPQSQTNDLGATVSFSVAATGTPAPVYQWRFNNSNITGATGASYSITNVQSSAGGSYSVIVTNIIGSTTSSTAILTLNAPPSITSQPQGLQVSVGQNATFNVTATGATPLYYQWRFNGANIGGATASSFTRNAVQNSDAGSYSVVVTNSISSVTSLDAVLTVTIPQGTVLIAQWNFNSPAPDGVATTGTLTPSTGNGTASYVGGTAAAGSGEFAAGSSTDPGSSDNSGWNTSTYPAQSTGNKTAGVQFSVSTAGKQNISIRWDQRESSTGSKYLRLRYTTNGTTFYDFPSSVSVAGTSFESKTNDLSAFPGANNSPNFAFRLVAEFESTATSSGSAPYVGASSTYAPAGTVRFDMVTISGADIPMATPPGITTHPQSQVVNQGASATFNVLATGSETLGYQWRFNSANLSGATASTYTRSNAQPADMGSYSVVVSNSAGTTNSSNAVLSLFVPQPVLTALSSGLLQWQGLSNLAYTVQAKTNLNEANWISIGSASSPTPTISFTNQPGSTQRFYRVVYP